MNLTSAVVCGPGRLRAENQDNFYLNGRFNEDPGKTTVQALQDSAAGQALYAVADGMGGENFGELAALTAVSTLETVPPCAGADGLTAYLLDRNADICRLMRERGNVRIGSAFVGLMVCDQAVTVVNIGDSRAYLLRSGQIKQISRDHTMAQQMVNIGVLTPEAARRHSDRHRLTQHLGIFPEEMVIEPFSVTGELCPGDLFLLCSDGLYEMVEHVQIQKLLKGQGTLREKAEALYAAACEAGGKDNITVLLIGVEQER